MTEPELPQRQADQRRDWQKAVAELHRKQRTKRAQRRAVTITGIVIPRPSGKDAAKPR